MTTDHREAASTSTSDMQTRCSESRRSNSQPIERSRPQSSASPIIEDCVVPMRMVSIGQIRVGCFVNVCAWSTDQRPGHSPAQCCSSSKQCRRHGRRGPSARLRGPCSDSVASCFKQLSLGRPACRLEGSGRPTATHHFSVAWPCRARMGPGRQRFGMRRCVGSDRDCEVSL